MGCLNGKQKPSHPQLSQPLMSNVEKNPADERRDNFLAFVKNNRKNVKQTLFTQSVWEGREGEKQKQIGQDFQEEMYIAKSENFSESQHNFQPKYQIVEDLVSAEPLQIDLSDFEFQAAQSMISNEGFVQENHVYNEFADKEVENIHEYPYSCVGVVYVLFQNQNKKKMAYGTGTLISEDIVLTCGHCLVESNSKDEGRVYWFGLRVKGGECEKYYVKEKFYFRSKLLENSFSYDFAILKLERKVRPVYGYLGFNIRDSFLIPNDEVMIVGYPQSKKKRMWKTDGLVENIQKNYIKHLSNTEKGFSGAAIIKKKNNKFYIAGVHIGFIEKQRKNVGIIFNKRMLKEINHWLGQNRVQLNLNKQQISVEMKKKIGTSILGVQQFQYLDKCDLLKQVTHFKINNHKVTLLHFQKFLPNVVEWNLKTLHLAQNELGDFSLLELLKFPTLVELNLSKNRQITIKGVLSISKLPNLQILYLNEINLQRKNLNQMTIFSALALFSKIKQVYLSSCSIQAYENELLFKEKQLDSLQVLDLSKNVIKYYGTVSIKFLPNLLSLNLLYCNIKDEGLKQLSKGKFTLLKELNLRNNNITYEGVKYLKYFPVLTSLYLGSNYEIGDLGLLQLSKFKFSLVKLDLSFTSITDKYIDILMEFSNHLFQLNLSQNDITKNGLEKLSKKEFPNLQRLNLSENEITGSVLDLVKQFKSLREINLNQTEVNEEEIEEIQSSINLKKSA